MKARIKRLIVRARERVIEESLYFSSRPRKILFDHLPKCGGTSLKEYLRAQYPKRRIFSTDSSNPDVLVDGFKRLSRHKRHGYDLVEGHLVDDLIDYVHPDCIKVTVLREPVDRIISHYYYAKSTKNHYLYSIIHQQNMSLKDYVTSNISDELQNWYTTHFSGLTVNDVERRPAESLARACNGVLERYDVIGFLDNYMSFINTLRSQARLGSQYKNKKANLTQGKPKISDIDGSTINIIQRVNHLDIILYRRIRDTLGK